MGNEVKQLLEFGPFRLDPEQRLLLRDQQPVLLSPKAFDLLLMLVQCSGQVVLKDDLMKTLWPDTFVEESNLGQHVFQLRRALSDGSQDSSHYIVTVPGRGYRFAHAVRACSARAEREDGDVVIESRTRSRVVVESVVAGAADQKSELAFIPGREPWMLPAPAAGLRWRGRQIAVLAIIAAVGGGLAVWAFFRPAPMPKVVRALRLTHNGRVEPGGAVLSDGRRLYFTERLGGASSLAEVAEQGGEPQLVSTSVPNIALYDIDPTRSRLLVGAQEPGGNSYPLWIVGTNGGSGQRVGNALAGDGAWAPDGHTVAYSSRTELYLANLDDQQSRTLFSSAGTILSLNWSPDGRKLSFMVRAPGGAQSLWEIARDGSNPHQVFPGWKEPARAWGEGECCGTWSPDGKYFVFRSIREKVQSLWILRERSSWFDKGAPSPVQLYTSPEGIGHPRFSLDGKRIFFADCHGCGRELLRYDSTRKLFVPYLGGIAARFLSFSRDGQWVTYKSDVDNTLWRSRLDGSQALQLTFPPLSVMHPTWSQDGKQIVFEADGKLYVISSGGGSPVPLVPGSQPSWSPDGKSILFMQYQPSATDAKDWHASIYQLDWSTRKIAVVPGSQDFEGPQWSPDGKYAAAANRKDKNLVIYDFAGQRWSAVAEGMPYGWGIRWSADSKYVYYQHNYGEEQPIFRVRISDRHVEQVTSSRQILRGDVLSYTMTGLTPDGSPLASLLRTNSDIYALQLELP